MEIIRFIGKVNFILFYKYKTIEYLLQVKKIEFRSHLIEIRS